MGSQNQLFDIADRQQGFFSAKQAEECGLKQTMSEAFDGLNEFYREIAIP